MRNIGFHVDVDVDVDVDVVAVDRSHVVRMLS